MWLQHGALFLKVHIKSAQYWLRFFGYYIFSRTKFP